MDPPTAAAIHPQDPASFIFQQAHFALQSTPADAWANPQAFSPPSPDPPQPRSAKSKPYARPPGRNSRLTRTKAAALARQSQEGAQQQPSQSSDTQDAEGTQEHHQPLQPFPAQPYTPSGYLTSQDDGPTQDPLDPQPFSTPAAASAVYQHPHYHLNFPGDAPASPSPPNSSSSNGPSHPPLHPQHSPLAFVASSGYPHMIVPGGVDGRAPFPGGLDDANTVYGSSGMSRGTEGIRLPSASPSIASGDIGSPGPEDYAGGGHARSSSSHYDYSGSGGPISPLSSSYAPQPLPSAFSSVTGGYLHGPPSAQSGGITSASAFQGAASTAESEPMPSTLSSRGRSGQKTKTKLTDMDRKFICVFAQNHPKARQEDIATKFAVERSTVSKILKCKEKWMKVDFFSSEARVVKHRPSKFPELEATLIHHIRVRIAHREPVNDSFIKKMALELADERGIGRDKFKASSGWVENFKHRHDLRKGSAWGTGASKYAQQPATPVSAPAPAPAADQAGADGAFSSSAAGDNASLFENVSGEFVTEESNLLDASANPPSPLQPLQSPFLQRHKRQERSLGGISVSSLSGDEYSSAASEFAVPPTQSTYPSLQVNTALAQHHRLGSMSPHALQSFLHPHISTPRSLSMSMSSMSRSTSSASLNSLGGAAAASSGFSPTSGSSPTQQFPPPPPFTASSFLHAPPGHGHHRRSMSASYTSSPLSIEVGAEGSVGAGTGASLVSPVSPRQRNSALLLDAGVAGGGGARASSGVSAAGAANRRSVQFTSFSAMAAGLNLGVDHHSRIGGHGRSLSSSAAGKVHIPLPVFEQDEVVSPTSASFHARNISSSTAGTSSTLVMPDSALGDKAFSDSGAAENMMGFIDTQQDDASF